LLSRKWNGRLLGKAMPLFLPVILWLTMAGAAGAYEAEKRLVPDTERHIIVLDPGHGGNDPGARGPDGSYEKDITLAAARMIAAELKGRYIVSLTRSDDYGLDIAGRTAAANHKEADLFLSIHTGAGFLHKTTGMVIFTHQGASRPDPSFPGGLPGPGGADKPEEDWDQIQTHHRVRTEQFADAIFSRICGTEPDRECRKVNAPLAVLMGADMPAILIEIGHITSPTEEKKLQDNAYLSGLIQEIILGIDDFFGQTTPPRL